MSGNIHIKLDHLEAVSIKKEALLCEENLLNIVGHIRSYDSLKKKEFTLKVKIKKDLASLKSLIISLESDLPKEEVKEVGQKYKTEEIRKGLREKEEVKKVTKNKEEHKLSDVEREIIEIRKRLANLG